MFEDSGKCVIALDSTSKDQRFWTQTAEDVYYKCNSYTCNDNSKIIQAESVNDWTNHIVDDDSYDPFCLPQTDYTLSLVYACR